MVATRPERTAARDPLRQNLHHAAGYDLNGREPQKWDLGDPTSDQTRQDQTRSASDLEVRRRCALLPSYSSGVSGEGICTARRQPFGVQELCSVPSR